MGKHKETWELAISVIKWGSAVVGGVCLLANILSTGEFLEDVSLGEGLVLYMLSAVFLFAYAIYWAGITSVGLWLLRWPMHALRRMAAKVPLQALGAIPADYSDMWSIPVWVLSILTAAFAVWLLRSYPLELLKCLWIALVQGFIGGVLILMRSRSRFQDSGISITRDKSDTDVKIFAGPLRYSSPFGSYFPLLRCPAK
jgi:hypothetical protein